jgi:hypothetical protein
VDPERVPLHLQGRGRQWIHLPKVQQGGRTWTFTPSHVALRAGAALVFEAR